MTPSPLRRVLLVGFMGAGKSTVGAGVGRALGWRFLDFDDVIEAEVGMTVPQIFAELGEAAFRRTERAVALRLLAEDRVVLASGGGWAAASGRLEALPGGTASIWLRVSAERALERVSEEPGRRPLLTVPDPLAEASRLLEEREAAYRSAHWTVDTDGTSVDDVTAKVVEILSRRYPNRI